MHNNAPHQENIMKGVTASTSLMERFWLLNALHMSASIFVYLLTLCGHQDNHGQVKNIVVIQLIFGLFTSYMFPYMVTRLHDLIMTHSIQSDTHSK
jgi:fucose permease